MITDKMMYFSEGQKLSGEKESENTLDFVQTAPTSGIDCEDLFIVTTVQEDVAGKLAVAVETSDKATTGFAAVMTSAEYDAPGKGTQIVLKLPRHHKRYLRLKYVGSPTAGKVTSCVTLGIQDNEAPYMHTGL